ncbi:glycosyl hydrolase family 3 [Colletotrichum higginsianum]|nr:glycosyl hydrolase family 3 [Colletotrichum higginsianum]
MLPSATGMGATFNAELLHKVGNLLGEEARARGVHVLLAPTICLQRSPLFGRGFEAFAEDPYLSGILGAAYINGVQERGVATSVKHYAAHDQSDNSIEDNVCMTQRTLREVHLMPFQLVMRDSDPWTFMTSYNKINGVHVSEDPLLLKQVLREEWGFKGLVMSDWFGTYSTSEALNAGLDLEMPGPTQWRVEPYYSVTPFDAIVEEVGKEHVSYALGCHSFRFSPLLKNLAPKRPQHQGFGWSVEVFGENPDENPGSEVLASAHAQKELIDIPESFHASLPKKFYARARATYTPSTSGPFRFGFSTSGKES